MMSPKPISEARSSDRAASIRHRPLQIIHIIGISLRVWSIYSLYQYLLQTKVSVVVFLFSCLVPASIIFLGLQKPWKGRALPNSQVVPSIINGGITALYFVLWGKGLKTCGPLIAILAEYAGAVLGVLSAVLYGRRSNIWKKDAEWRTVQEHAYFFPFYLLEHLEKHNDVISPGDRLYVENVGGLLAMLMSFYFLSQGWATRTYSPFYSFGHEPLVQVGEVLGIKEMTIPISAGILSALRRVIARRVSLKNQQKRRLHAITITSAVCFLFPFAIWDMVLGSFDRITTAPFPTWAYLSTVIFGIVLIFYVDNLAEERLHLVFSSPKHLMAAGGCIILMEVAYKMDFSLTGFLICSLILGLGIFEATSLERVRREPSHPHDISEEALQNQLHMSPLPT